MGWKCPWWPSSRVHGGLLRSSQHGAAAWLDVPGNHWAGPACVDRAWPARGIGACIGARERACGGDMARTAAATRRPTGERDHTVVRRTRPKRRYWRRSIGTARQWRRQISTALWGGVAMAASEADHNSVTNKRDRASVGPGGQRRGAGRVRQRDTAPTLGPIAQCAGFGFRTESNRINFISKRFKFAPNFDQSKRCVPLL
jgi:hypothetical protein